MRFPPINVLKKRRLGGLMVRRRFPVPKTCGFEVSVRFQVAVVQKPSSNIDNSPVLVDNSNDVIFFCIVLALAVNRVMIQLINNVKMQCYGHACRSKNRCRSFGYASHRWEKSICHIQLPGFNALNYVACFVDTNRRHHRSFNCLEAKVRHSCRMQI
jgi:hypothetical protein